LLFLLPHLWQDHEHIEYGHDEYEGQKITPFAGGL